MPVRRRRYAATVPRGSWRIEIGSGLYPTAGYFHVDVSPWNPHLEAAAPMWQLPLPDAVAIEVRAIHSLEHAQPPRLVETLREWRRVLTRGGKVHISVPNAPAIMEAFQQAAISEKWPLMGSMLGMYCTPDDRDPSALQLRADHQIVFDRAVLEWALREAGFTEITDETEHLDDRHSLAWRHLVERYSLIMCATA
jgi:hypothetical protein